jgi:hypothetical protein
VADLLSVSGQNGPEDPQRVGQRDPLPEPATTGELFVYPGDRHLFTDSSLPSYDPDAALVVQRSREFLRRMG